MMMAVAVLLTLPSLASGAITFGSDLNLLEVPTQRSSSGPATISLTDVPEASRAEGGVSAPIDGVVVRWRIRTAAGTTSPPTPTWTARFRLLRVNTGTGLDAPVQVADTTAIQTFPTRLPVEAGDDIGLDTPGGESFFVRPGGGLNSFWSPPLGPTETRSPFLTPVAYPLMNADVERDVDGDSFGDETQDECPSDPSTQDACDRAAPDTSITRAPKRRLRKRKATVEFAAEGAAGFECAVDGPEYVPCASPLKLKRLKPGKHVMAIRATDAAGNVESSPAIAKFRVVRR